MSLLPLGPPNHLTLWAGLGDELAAAQKGAQQSQASELSGVWSTPQWSGQRDGCMDTLSAEQQLPRRHGASVTTSFTIRFRQDNVLVAPVIILEGMTPGTCASNAQAAEPAPA